MWFDRFTTGGGKRENMKLLTKIGEILLPTKLGNFNMVVFKNNQTGKFASALIVGQVKRAKNVLLRIHSSCLTGDVFGSLLCDCGSQLEMSLDKISKEGTGVIIYLDQEGRGIGLDNKILAMELQQKGLDTVDANLLLGLPVDARKFDEAVEIINRLGISSVRVLTNNPNKISDLLNKGVKVSSRLECISTPAPVTRKYLKTKKERMGHLLPI